MLLFTKGPIYRFLHLFFKKSDKIVFILALCLAGLDFPFLPWNAMF